MSESFDEQFTEIVNNLCRLDMKYTFVTDEFDEILARLRVLDESVTKRIAGQKYQIDAFRMAEITKKRGQLVCVGDTDL